MLSVIASSWHLTPKTDTHEHFLTSHFCLRNKSISETLIPCEALITLMLTMLFSYFLFYYWKYKYETVIVLLEHSTAIWKAVKTLLHGWKYNKMNRHKHIKSFPLWNLYCDISSYYTLMHNSVMLFNVYVWVSYTR